MEAVLKSLLDLTEELTCYININPAFRMRPIGAPGSAARANQDAAIALEDSAKATIKRAEVEIRRLEKHINTNKPLRPDGK